MESARRGWEGSGPVSQIVATGADMRWAMRANIPEQNRYPVETGATLLATETATRRHGHANLIPAGQEHRVSVIRGAEPAVTWTAATS